MGILFTFQNKQSQAKLLDIVTAAKMHNDLPRAKQDGWQMDPCWLGHGTSKF